MKKLYIFLFFACLIFTANAQVVINEFTPDPGNYDGQGAEWTELYNKSATAADVSCWVLTDGEEIVVFPTGTTIPGNGYLIIYNGNFFNPTNNSGNWYNSFNTFIANNGATVKSINLATCGCTNQTGCFAVTWDNPSGNNGTDRIVLFNQNAVIQSALYYGIGDNYAAASAPISESVYATGPNTANKNITGGAVGCTLPATNNYDIPALPATAGTNGGVWEYAGNTINGCTTSKARSTNGGLIWIDDNYPTPAANNANPDFKVTYTLNGGAEVDITATDNILLNVCSGATISFNGEVYDFNQVYNTNAGDPAVLEGGSSRGGSHVVATGGLVFDNSWAEAAVTTTGLTALSYPTTPTITANTTFKLFIKENTSGAGVNPNSSDCAAAGSTIVGSGAASECYILKTITVNVIQPLVGATLNCTNGLVKVTATPALATGLTYNLINSANATLNQTNTTGQFQVTSGTAANYSVQVVQNPACGTAAPLAGICVFAPPCPTFTAYDACTTAAGPICPGSNISLSLTGTNLPNGGKVEWVNDTNNDGDVYDEVASAVVASQDITVTGGGTPSGPPKLNEVLFNATTEAGTTNGEAWEIAGTPGASIGCHYFTDGDFVVQLPSTAVLPPSGFYVIGGSSYTPQAGQPAANLTLAATTGLGNLTNSNGSATSNGEFLVLFNPSNTFVNGVYWGPITSGLPSASTASNNPQNISATAPSAALTVTGAGCAVLPTWSIIRTNVINAQPTIVNVGNLNGNEEQSIELSSDLGTAWQLSATPGSAVNTLGSSNAPGSVTTLSPTCVTYAVPTTACNTNLNLKPRISPAQTGCTPGTPSPTLATKAFSVNCPTAIISGQKAICSGSTTSFDVTLTGFGNNTTATVSYSINGSTAITTAALSINVGKVTIPNLTAAGVYTLTNIVFGGGTSVCAGSTSGDVTITVASNPTAPTDATVSTCANATTALYASGGEGPSYNWYSNAALTTLVATGSPYYYNGGNTTLYVESSNPDNGCKSAAAVVTVLATPNPILTIPATLNCNSGFFDQDATSGTGTLTYTLAGKTLISGTSSSAVGSSNTTGIFNLGGCTGATILVTDANGCFAINTYDFNAPPYNCIGALSLKLYGFSVLKEGKNARITWKTTDDVAVAKYYLQNSNDGIHFKNIHEVKSNKSSLSSYLYIDNAPSIKNYYRVLAKLENNEEKISEIKKLFFENKFVVNVLQNPVSNTINITLNETSEKIISVFNTAGKIFYAQKNNMDCLTIDCSNWIKGTYYLKVFNVNRNETVTKKIIKL